MTSIQYRAIVAASVPLILAVIGIFGKRLTRGTVGSWKRSDLYLGVELSLAGVSAAVLNLFDLLLKPGILPTAQAAVMGPVMAPPSMDVKLIVSNFMTAFLGLVLFMFVLILHQDYERETNVTNARKKELWMLAGAANLLGCIVLLAAVASLPV